jgi:TP901 family phage tail tape measure protein
MNPTVIPAIFRAKDEMSAKMKAMQQAAASFNDKLASAGKTAFSVARKAAIVGTVIAAPLVLSAKAAVDFEEKMADVSKTTGMNGSTLERFGNDLLAMSTKTRTSIDDLSTIAEIGGQLGIAQKDLLGFTKSANEFNIALGKDFSGGVEEAVASIGKIKTLFTQTKDLNIADAISKTGSAINELGAVGNGTSANITDFTLRMGALPENLKATAQSTMALGAYLEEMGIDSQIAAGGMTNLLLVAGREINGFAKQMGISSDQAKQLLAQDPTKFASKFASSFKGMAPEKMAQSLEGLKVGSQETIKVIGALGMNTQRLTDLQNISNKAFAENNSLKNEAAKKEQTAAAQMAKLKNNMQALAITVGNALLPVINDLVQAVMPYVQGIANWIKNNKALTGTIVKVALAAAGLAYGISIVAGAIGVYQKAVVIAEAAQKIWNMTLLANPIGLVIVGVAALAAGIYGLSKAFSGMTTSEELASDVRKRAMENTIDQRVEVQLLFNALRNAKVGSDQYKSTLEKIDQLSPGLTAKYNLQAGALNNINKAEKELINNIMKRAEAEARAEMLKESVKEELRLKQEGPGMLNNFVGQMFGPALGTVVTENLHQKDIADEQNKQQILSQQIYQAEQPANPAAAKAKNGEQKIVIEFSNLPDWMKPMMKNANNGAGMPILSKTK